MNELGLAGRPFGGTYVLVDNIHRTAVSLEDGAFQQYRVGAIHS